MFVISGQCLSYSTGFAAAADEKTQDTAFLSIPLPAPIKTRHFEHKKTGLLGPAPKWYFIDSPGLSVLLKHKVDAKTQYQFYYWTDSEFL
jgi:hypothetical protein